VAPELRIRYHLERVYGILRDARFRRVRDPISRTAPPAHLHVVDIELRDARRSLSELDVPVAPAAEMSTTEDLGLAPFGLRAPPPEPRRRVPSSSAPPAELGEPPASIPPITDWGRGLPGAEPAIARGTRSIQPTTNIATLADEAIAAGEAFLASIQSPRTDTRETGKPESLAFASVEEAAEALRCCGDRDQLTRLAVQAAVTLAPTKSAIFLVVQDDTAVGLVGVNERNAIPRQVLSEIVVPLDQPGLIATAVLRKGVTRGSSRTLAGASSAACSRRSTARTATSSRPR
jgi:hypothetical protein